MFQLDGESSEVQSVHLIFKDSLPLSLALLKLRSLTVCLTVVLCSSKLPTETDLSDLVLKYSFEN